MKDQDDDNIMFMTMYYYVFHYNLSVRLSQMSLVSNHDDVTIGLVRVSRNCGDAGGLKADRSSILDHRQQESSVHKLYVSCSCAV